MSHKASLLAEPRQLVNKVSGETMRPVERRTGAISVAIKGVLNNSHFSRAGIKDFRSLIYKGAPGVVKTCTDAFAQSFLHADLHGMVDRRRGVGAQTDGSLRWVNPAAVCRGGYAANCIQATRVTINSLKQPSALRSDISDTQY